MILGKVSAKITGSIQHPAYLGHPLYSIRELKKDGAEGRSFVALDTVGCALGDEVLVARVPGLARALLGVERAPVRSLILAILDAHPS